MEGVAIIETHSKAAAFIVWILDFLSHADTSRRHGSHCFFFPSFASLSW